jgi:hypothetical protein
MVESAQVADDLKNIVRGQSGAVASV